MVCAEDYYDCQCVFHWKRGYLHSEWFDTSSEARAFFEQLKAEGWHAELMIRGPYRSDSPEINEIHEGRKR